MRRSDLTLLRVPAFRRLFAARTISIFGSAFTPVALAFAILDLPGAGPRDLGIILTALEAATLVTVLLGGVLGDRFSSTRILMVGETIAALAIGGMATEFATGMASPYRIAVLGAIAGAGMGLIFPILAALVPATAPADRLQPANALLRLTATTMQILGSALAGLAVAAFGAGRTLYVDAASYAVAVAIVWGIPARLRERQGTSMLHELRVGWKAFISFKWLWPTTLTASLFSGAFHAGIGVLGPVVARAAYGGARGWSLVLAAMSVGGILGTVVAARVRPRRPMVLICLLFLPSAFLLVMLAPPAPLWAVIGAAAGTGFAFAILVVVWETLLQTHVPAEVLARVSSYDYLGSAGTVPIATAVVGTLAATIGAPTTLLWGGALIAVSGFAPLLLREVRQLGLEPVAAAPVAPGV